MNQESEDIRLIVLGGDHGAMAVSLLATLVGGIGGTGDDIVGSGPRIVAINNAGKEYVVQQFSSLKKANRALSPMVAELHQLGKSAWCQAHNVPPDFETW